MLNKNILFALLLLAPLSFADDVYVSHAKTLDVYSLDQSLQKNTMLPDYLAKVLPKGTGIEWSKTVTDCGENDGSGNQEDYPLCAEILFHTPNGGKGYLYIALGSTKTGLNGAPEIFDGGYDLPSGKSQDIRKLSDLASLITDSKMAVANRDFFYTETLDTVDHKLKDCFELPTGIVNNWEILARQYYADIDLNVLKIGALDTKLTWYDYEPGGYYFLRYEAEVPPNVKALRWLVISLQGVTEVSATTLSGTIEYESGSTDPNAKPSFSPGKACFTYVSKGNNREAYRSLFATILAANEEIKQVVVTPKTFEMHMQAGDQDFTLAAPLYRFPPMPTYAFLIGSTLYYVAAWPDEGNGCNASFTLFKVENAASKEVARAGGNCD